MCVCVTFWSCTGDNLMALVCVHVIWDRQIIVIILCPDICPPLSPPHWLIVSSFLSGLTPTWRPDRPHPSASWIINILSVCCQYPPDTEWTGTHVHLQPHMATHVICKAETAVYRCDGGCLLDSLILNRAYVDKFKFWKLSKVMLRKNQYIKCDQHIWTYLFGVQFTTHFFSDASLESRPRYDSW